MSYEFPYFYKIYLMIYPTLPIPSDVEVRAIFYDNNGTCCAGLLSPIKIRFEDYFLPIRIPLKYEKQFLEDEEEKQSLIKNLIFKNLWNKFKIKDENKFSFVNTCKLLNLDRENMIKLVISRLKPFLININFLDLDYILRNPFNLKDLEVETLKEEEKSKNFIFLKRRQFKSFSQS